MQRARSSRRGWPAWLAAAALAVTAVGVLAPTAEAVPPTDDPMTGAELASAWLADTVTPDGYVEGFGGAPATGATIEVALSLAATRTNDAAFAAAVAWLTDNAEAAIVDGNGVDSPGSIGGLLLVLDAAGLGPDAVSDVDLLARLADSLGDHTAGLYGETDPTFDGAFRQSLALLGLAAHGVTPPASAVQWLVDQQCDGTNPGALGGWMAYRADLGTPCPTPSAVTFEGPDTNQTAMAAQALAALGTTPTSDPLTYLGLAQGADGGFPYYPGGDVDPNSTSLVVQALVASGEDPAAAPWAGVGTSPLSSLLSWQLDGPDEGALASPYSAGAADAFATRQAPWGLAGEPFPLRTAPGAPAVTVDTRATTATVRFEAPTFGGGQARTGYTVTTSAGGPPIVVGPDVDHVDLNDLEYGSRLTATVTATNVEGPGRPGADAALVGFTDVADTATFFDDIVWLTDAGTATGYADDTFRPTAPVTRGSMAAFVYRTAGSPIGADPSCTEAPFDDVAVDSTFCGEIAWLVNVGITDGYGDGTYRPGAPVTRQSMAAFLQRLVEPDTTPPACAEAPFTDVPVGALLCPEIRWASANGVAEGFGDGSFRPTTVVSRQAMAGFLHRLDSIEV